MYISTDYLSVSASSSLKPSEHGNHVLLSTPKPISNLPQMYLKQCKIKKALSIDKYLLFWRFYKMIPICCTNIFTNKLKPLDLRINTSSIDCLAYIFI